MISKKTTELFVQLLHEQEVNRLREQYGSCPICDWSPKPLVLMPFKDGKYHCPWCNEELR